MLCFFFLFWIEVMGPGFILCYDSVDKIWFILVASTVWGPI
jgi:hypothetical protein